ncbi:conserved hypothetical protein [Pseudoalteromonas sp. SM9913]|nr:conserved hypothetical protein [Pseudoalteromonas sp. SM9913]
MEVVMIEDVEGYKSYLRDVRGLVEGTVNSYPTYLSAITNHLHIDITADSVYSSESVKDILRRLKASLKEKNYWGNCQSALKAYLEFLEFKTRAASPLNSNEERLLNYLVSHIQSGAIDTNNPMTHLPYSKVLNDLEFPNDGRTPGYSLNKHAMGGLAEWLHNNKLPAVTGIIINNKNHPDRALFPSKSYFEFHKKQDMDFAWQRHQIKIACELDWGSELASRGVYLLDNFSFAEEVNELLKEGARKTITVNAYERNPEARNLCIKEYGTRCCVCDFSFVEFYGKRGEGYIHVHHLTPVSEIKSEYDINPIRDLRPVCPNCHAMLHRKGNISIEELVGEISFNKALKRASR